VTLPRAKRGQRPRPGVRFHAVQRPPTSEEVRSLHGIPVTTPERTIVDALAAGTQPEQVALAIHQALERGLTTRRRLQAATTDRSARVRGLIDQALQEMHA
jgi:predicted transcriptional regulator of viral defense system